MVNLCEAFRALLRLCHDLEILEWGKSCKTVVFWMFPFVFAKLKSININGHFAQGIASRLFFYKALAFLHGIHINHGF